MSKQGNPPSCLTPAIPNPAPCSPRPQIPEGAGKNEERRQVRNNYYLCNLTKFPSQSGLL